MIAYAIPKRASSCKGCKKSFEPQDLYISTLKMEGELFVREDFCSACPPESADASWKNCVEKKAETAKSVPQEIEEGFARALEKLAGLKGEERVKVSAEAYLLAHLLVRHRKLLIKKEPLIVDERKGALFQSLEGEEGFFIDTPFSLYELGEAKARLKAAYGL